MEEMEENGDEDVRHEGGRHRRYIRLLQQSTTMEVPPMNHATTVINIVMTSINPSRNLNGRNPNIAFERNEVQRIQSEQSMIRIVPRLHVGLLTEASPASPTVACSPSVSTLHLRLFSIFFASLTTHHSAITPSQSLPLSHL